MSTHFPTVSEARDHFKDMLDAAEAGLPASVVRDSRRSALVDAERLRQALGVLRPAGAEVVAENDGWVVVLPGLPIAAEASTLEEALTDLVDGLRDYAEDWGARLRNAPNHAENWGLVQFVELSSDEQVKEWLVHA